MRSNSYQGPHTPEEAIHDERSAEKLCTTCRGHGEDRNGVDCMVCGGYGTVLTEVFGEVPL
jgi:DnaJ-class molecular chaperone